MSHNKVDIQGHVLRHKVAAQITYLCHCKHISLHIWTQPEREGDAQGDNSVDIKEFVDAEWRSIRPLLSL